MWRGMWSALRGVLTIVVDVIIVSEVCGSVFG